VFSSCPKRGSHFSSAVQKWFFRSMLGSVMGAQLQVMSDRLMDNWN
jgi:hypothetical protein